MKQGLEQILKKSSGLMARQGYHGTSMRDLARETDRSLGGLYHYFKSKEELIYIINHKGFSSLLELANNLEREKLGSEEKLYAFIHNHLRYFGSHLNELRVMMFGTQHLDFKQGKALVKLKSNYAAIGENIVGTYIKEFSDRRVQKKDISRETYFLFGMMNWIFSWYSAEQHGTGQELIDEVFTTFTRGAAHKKKTDLRAKTKVRDLYRESELWKSMRL